MKSWSNAFPNFAASVGSFSVCLSVSHSLLRLIILGQPYFFPPPSFFFVKHQKKCSPLLAFLLFSYFVDRVEFITIDLCWGCRLYFRPSLGPLLWDITGCNYRMVRLFCHLQRSAYSMDLVFFSKSSTFFVTIFLSIAWIWTTMSVSFFFTRKMKSFQVNCKIAINDPNSLIIRIKNSWVETGWRHVNTKTCRKDAELVCIND